ncbi:endonuclease/exonuclease/phosphatase family protein [Streptomyces sp. bgisy060]|uniref:endonuclease/exonuclease/phosphatase family protein n=1 Tax=Streptomyces sp. bgisy060 TaxID=3413775 RepID=UPI003EB9AFF2
MTKPHTLTVVSWNFEANGKGNQHTRHIAHQKLAGLGANLVFRQEMWGADADGEQVMQEMERLLGMRGWLGERSCTAIFADHNFEVVRQWNAAPLYVLPPTALAMRYTPAGPDAAPFVGVSYHLNYASPTNRLIEAEWLTTWADKRWATPRGDTLVLPCISCGDANSYPHADVDGAPVLPVLKEIQDQPHRLHRSYVGPDGRRLMDTRPDEALRTAGLEDVARHRALAGDLKAVARTVDRNDTHGPDARIDRVYVTPELLPAVRDVDVIEVPLELSDHHMVRVKLDADVLADILRAVFAGAA